MSTDCDYSNLLKDWSKRYQRIAKEQNIYRKNRKARIIRSFVLTEESTSPEGK